MRKENLIFGACISAIGYLFAAASAACSKLLGKEISVFTIVFFQNAICLIFTFSEQVKEGFSSLKTQRFGLHLARDISGFVCFFLFYSSLKYIPLVDGVLLMYTGPLWIPFIALIYPRVKMKNHTWWGILIGFLGIVFILKPGTAVLNPGAFMGLASGFLAGFSAIAVRRLSQTESTNQILFYYFLFGTIVSAPFFYFSMQSISSIELLNLLGVGLFAYLSQSLTTHAYRHGKASVMSPISYLAIVGSGILGWILWHELPDVVALCGMILVICGGILSIYFEKRYEKRMREGVR